MAIPIKVQEVTFMYSGTAKDFDIDEFELKLHEGLGFDSSASLDLSLSELTEDDELSFFYVNFHPGQNAEINLFDVEKLIEWALSSSGASL